jgi:DMSO/TMAO reductase YedYZ molybdopterin-dependent catalytic subunit
MLTRHSLVAFALLIAAAAVAPLHAAEPQTGLVVVAPPHAPVELSASDLAQLPTTRVNTAFLTEHGTHSAAFEGPLLWTVLEKSGVVDPAKHREQVSQTIMIVGRDGYRAVLALGEIAPEFEGKQVILAERMEGKPLDAEHLRVVVPLDKRGGRSVRDVTRIELTGPSDPQ